MDLGELDSWLAAVVAPLSGRIRPWMISPCEVGLAMSQTGLIGPRGTENDWNDLRFVKFQDAPKHHTDRFGHSRGWSDFYKLQRTVLAIFGVGPHNLPF